MICRSPPGISREGARDDRVFFRYAKGSVSMNDRCDPAEFGRIFRPRAIAVVGSARSQGDSQTVPHSFFFVMSLRNMHFEGPLYIVSRSGSPHPSLDEMVFPSLLDIPGPVDHAILCVPAAAVPGVLEQCAAKGVRSAAIFSSGFSESASAEGKRLEEAIRGIARRSSLRIIGPNCMGIYCPETGLNFRPDLPCAPGPVAMVSQSGGMAIRTIFQGVEKGLGFSKVVSYGNEVDVQSWELIDYLGWDEATRIILVYIEGTRDGRSLLRALKEAGRRKPVVVLKGGLSAEGTRAAMSHTGSLAGNEAVWQAMIRQARAHPVKDVNDLVDTAMTFCFLKRPAGKRIALMCISGGLVVNYTDLAVRSGFEVPAFDPSTQRGLEEIINEPGTSCSNPIDMASLFFNRRIYSPLFQVLNDDTNTDLILFIIAMEYVTALQMQYRVSLSGLVQAFLDIVSKVTKPFVAVIPPVVEEESRLEVERAFLKAGIPTFITMEGAMNALRARINDPREDPVRH